MLEAEAYLEGIWLHGFVKNGENGGARGGCLGYIYGSKNDMYVGKARGQVVKSPVYKANISNRANGSVAAGLDS